MNRTEKLIMNSFLSLLEKKPYNKIKVKDIVEDCQVNRNTFYYHFHDIPDLLNRYLKEDLDHIIHQQNNFENPVDCLITISQLIINRKEIILNIYHSMDRTIYINYLDELTLYFVNEYAKNIVSSLNQEDKEILIRFYKSALVGVLLDWVDHEISYDLISSCRRLSSLFENSQISVPLKSKTK
ncbi:TetR/AcrR family transcriptional regulator C-terminal domain-containing protein [Floccifex sp.]|uniref:TetR/AcrR family transcriptional regulator C-terminal domain-containing protein n=1 Tax=Floccifex sp. TaxID=2815810 RepID=UPI003F01C0EF